MPRRQLPWSTSCFVCGDENPLGLGIRFRVDGDSVKTDTVLDPSFEGYPGYAHGGVITALLDETVGWACSVAGRRLYYTLDISVRFKLPVPAGVPIVVVGQLREVKRRIAYGYGWIEDEEGAKLATAEGRFFPLPISRHDAVVAMLKMPDRPARPDDI